MGHDDDSFGARLRGLTQAVPQGRLGRLWRTGRSAMGMASTVLSSGREFDRATVERLASRLGELKGVGMKMGQILSFIDPTMSPEVRDVLGALQRNAPRSEPAAVRAALTEAFGPLRAEVLLTAMDPEPFSVASIGQVHRARLPEHGDVVVKVRHPGIAQALETDFANASSGVGMVNTVLFGMARDAQGMVDEGRKTMLAECDFAGEAAHQRAFRKWLDPNQVCVPEVIDEWSTAGVLTTRFEPGLGLEAFLAANPTQAQRDVAGIALFRLMVGGFHELGLLYADPHPGNFAFRVTDASVRVVAYDFGCVRAFTREDTAAFSSMASALREGSRLELLGAARAFGFGIETVEHEETFVRFAKGFFNPMLVTGAHAIAPDGAVEASALIRDKRELAKLRLPAKMLFLLRLRFGLYAVLARLGARADWGALELEASQRASRTAA